MPYGYMGKILRVNLTTGVIGTINTSDYEEWGGGNGIGAAIFWDLVEDRTLNDGFDERNVLTLMTSPLAGTLSPVVGARIEQNGIQTQSYPINWFGRSNSGGRFGAMLKWAGWDGIVIEGKAASPCWLNIVNDNVTLEDAGPDGDDLWGLDTYETQEEIWRRVTGYSKAGEWLKLPGDEYTTQKPAVMAIGQMGETQSRIACIIHDRANASGQGGYGGVWGSKNLKAISVLGTQSVEVANPKELMDGRLWFLHDEYNESSYSGWPASRRSACVGCPVPCRRRYVDNVQNEAQCVEATWTQAGPTTLDRRRGADLLNRAGFNVWEKARPSYLLTLYELGVLGPGKEIDSAPLAMDQYGTVGWGENYLRCIANREGIGDALAEGIIRAAESWGRLEEDLSNNMLRYPQWGYPSHWTLPSIEWAYGSLMGERDTNEHDYDQTCQRIRSLVNTGDILPERAVEILSEKCPPYDGDPWMFEYSYQEPDGSRMAEALEVGIYSAHKAKLVGYHRHYTRFWKQSIQYCDWHWNRYINTGAEALGYQGSTPFAEPLFFEAVTGKNVSFTDGIEIGRRIWNLQRALWALEGRTRELEVFAPYMYEFPTAGASMPVYIDGKWDFNYYYGGGDTPGPHPEGMFLDRDGVETWKTHYYTHEGWDVNTGWPTRATLEGLNLGNVADELEAHGKLGVTGVYQGP